MTPSPSSAAGTFLGAATRAVGALRPAAKPLHPRGSVWDAEVVRTGATGRPSGVAWIDTPGTDRSVVRFSPGIGLPRGWPDVQGIALRVLLEQGPADLLLATTGAGRLSRFVLVPATASEHRTHTTLLPYRGPRGPLLLGAVPTGAGEIALSWASLGGPWTPFGTVRLTGASTAQPSFDPVLHRLPGLEQYGWVSRLRLPAYGTARRQRGEAAVD
jgi:hypothetical protein